MKHTISLFLLITFWVSLSGCAISRDGSAQTLDSSKTVQKNSQGNLPMKQDDEILSKDYVIAKKALDKAVLEKDKHIIKLGLKSQYFPIKQKTVEAIAEIEDESFVPDLIKSLRGNQGMFTGGTETKGMQNDLNKAIISALAQLTNLKFEVSTPLSDEDINEVINKSQNWCKSHKKNM